MRYKITLLLFMFSFLSCNFPVSDNGPLGNDVPYEGPVGTIQGQAYSEDLSDTPPPLMVMAF